MQLPIVGTMLLLFGILRGPVQPDVRDDVLPDGELVTEEIEFEISDQTVR